MAEIHDMSALEQGAAIRRREVSPLELVDHYLRRIERLSDTVGAFVTVTAEKAREAARKATQDTIAGDVSAGEGLSPLFGVPTAIKDLNLTAGVPTKFGSTITKDFIAPLDDYVVEHMNKAGLISLGKTNVPEFGLPCYTEPDVAPPARTPYDRTRSAGGSSGGGAAAVSAGLVPVAQGNDGAGSIRIPASVCGLVGLKTSRGRISGGPIFANITGLPVDGPLSRTVADAAALLDILAGPMPGDPYWAPPLPPGEKFLDACKVPPGRLQVGRYIEPIIPGAVVAEQCVVAYEEASKLLEELGHDVEDCAPPFSPDIVPKFETIWAVGAASLPVPPDLEGQLRPLTRWLRQKGRSVSATDFAEALAAVQLASRTAVINSSRYDVILLPTLAQPPVLVGALRNDQDPSADFEAQKRFAPFTAAYNVTGQPSISLPLYWTPDGLPIGIQIVGPQAKEALLLSLAAQLENVKPWINHRPSCW
ncbi:MAG: amidase [Actinobacteria bacterium]|nr:amidase [Actinomycetota bacterium]MCL6104423.1 amidase [Actinomycetota bacterium]